MKFEADDFWTVDDFVTPKKKAQPNGFDTETVTVSVGGNGENHGAEPIPPKKDVSPETRKKLDAAKAALKKALLASSEKSAKRSLDKERRNIPSEESDIITTDDDIFSDIGDISSTQKVNKQNTVGISSTFANKSDNNPKSADIKGYSSTYYTVSSDNRNAFSTDKSFLENNCDITSTFVEESFTYKPENPLIKAVTVSSWSTHFAFHERFREDAVKFSKMKGSECEYAPFYAYSPTYIQLTPGQKNYYLYFRDSAKEGRFIKTTSAYVVLAAAETVNTADIADTEKSAEFLCNLYIAYSDSFEIVAKLMPQWIYDYCIINKTVPTYDFCRLMAGKPSETAEILRGFGRCEDPIAGAVLSVSAHSFESSKTVTEENRSVFEKYVPDISLKTVSEAIKRGLKPFDGKRPWFTIRETLRSSYPGLTCAYNFKKTIKTEAIAVTRSQEMCRFAAEIIEYSENRVRSLLGIKNRYHITAVSDEIKSITDGFFRSVPSERKAEPKPVPEYEKLYDTDDKTVSASEAMEIEENAWKVTALLTDNEDFSEETEKSAADTETADRNDGGEMALAVRAVRALLGGDETFEDVAKSLNIFPDAFADGVNETLFDIFGDNAVEYDGEKYFIGCYYDEVTEWLKQYGM